MGAGDSVRQSGEPLRASSGWEACRAFRMAGDIVDLGADVDVVRSLIEVR